MAPAREDLLPVPARDARFGGQDARRRFDELFRRHSASVARLVFRLLGREDEMDDIVQDVFFALFRSLNTIRRPEAIRSWLLTTAVRTVRRRFRLRRIGFMLGKNQRVDPITLDANDSSTEDRVALWTIHQALQRAPLNARLAWILHHLELEGLDEVARALGCSRATAKRRVAEAQHQIDKALEP